MYSMSDYVAKCMSHREAKLLYRVYAWGGGGV